MFTKKFLFSAACASLVVLAACSDEQMPTQANAAGARSTSSHAPQLAVRTLDDDFVDLAHEVPGFGGMYVDDAGDVVVRLKNPGSVGLARAAVARMLTRHGRAEDAARLGSSMKTLPADYDFAELVGWYHSFRALGVPGVSFGDVDERQNRVVIGVTDATEIAGVHARLAELGVPAEAVIVKVVPLVKMEARLIDAVRPVVGGVQVQSSVGYCTLGYNVKRTDGLGVGDGQRYFVTNSHCTDVWGSVTPTDMYQPDYSAHAGVEVLDPPALSTYSGCPAGRVCRYSDAALIQYDASVSSSFPYVANVGTGSNGNASIIGNWPMVNEQFTYVGDRVFKVGRTTGFSAGNVQQSCYDQGQADSYGYDTGRTLLCQNRADYTSSGGDSGSPVYHKVSDTDRRAAGLHWGSGGVYSQIYYVLRDFNTADGGYYSVGTKGFFTF